MIHICSCFSATKMQLQNSDFSADEEPIAITNTCN